MSIHNPKQCKLGRQPRRCDPRTLQLAKYLETAGAVLPPAPLTKNWGDKVSAWGMMLNDTLGDCTIASAAHMVLSASTNNEAPKTISDADIQTAYSAVSGYVAGDPSTDNGAVELDVLNYWRQTGIGGDKIEAYAAIDLSENEALIKQAIWLFGGIYIGVDLPLSAQDQDVWNITGADAANGHLIGRNQPGSWGGHAIPVLGYDTQAYQCVTWGAAKWMTKAWFDAYVTEAYVVISPDWVPPAGVAPNALDLKTLQGDLALVTSGD